MIDDPHRRHRCTFCGKGRYEKNMRRLRSKDPKDPLRWKTRWVCADTRYGGCGGSPPPSPVCKDGEHGHDHES